MSRTEIIIMKKKIAIQGYAGSFHELAARQVFGEDIEIVPCKTFHELFKITEHDSSISGAVAAIENSIAGSILPNYRLLQESHLLVTGEAYLPIRQHLLALPEVKLGHIKEVYSHPMALLQCTDFLDRFQFKLVESEDTALSAKIISAIFSSFTRVTNDSIFNCSGPMPSRGEMMPPST